MIAAAKSQDEFADNEDVQDFIEKWKDKNHELDEEDKEKIRKYSKEIAIKMKKFEDELMASFRFDPSILDVTFDI